MDTQKLEQALEMARCADAEPQGEPINGRECCNRKASSPTEVDLSPPAHQPQQRQPLTDYEIDRFWMNRPNLHDGELLPQLHDFARAVERAHGIGEAP